MPCTPSVETFMKTSESGMNVSGKRERLGEMRGRQADPDIHHPMGDLVAHVRYQGQQFTVSLNPYDGWEAWQTTMSEYVRGPFEMVFQPDKGACSHDHGISIVDRRSFLEAMKIVERTRSTNSALRFQLYPIRDETDDSTAGGMDSSFRSPFIPTLNTSKRDEEMRVKLRKIRLSEKTLPSAPQEQSIAQTLESKLMALPKDDEECPKWALDLKKEIFDFIDQRFEELSTSVHTEIANLSTQISTVSSPRMSHGEVSQKSGSSGSDHSFILSGMKDRLEEYRSLSSQMDVSAWNNDMSGNGQSAFGDSFTRFGAPLVASAPVQEVADLPIVTPKSSLSRSDSGSGSVVIVTPPESFGLQADHEHGAVTENGEFEVLVVNAAGYEDRNSETGSVAYVDTENEDENDLTSLKSWAQDAASVSTVRSEGDSPMTESFMTTKFASLNNSFHSVVEQETVPVEDDQDQEEIFHETILYKPIPIPVSDFGAVDESPAYQDEVPSLVGDDPLAADQAGNEMLPPDLNAMQPLDDQTTFSPNSDLGTMLLSAASSIATGFMQSMESLSQTIRAYEERRNQAEQAHRRESTVETRNQPTEVIQEEVVSVQVDDIPAQVEQQEEEVPAPVEVPPPVPPRARGPPPNNGLYMSEEEIQWFTEQYGIKEWWNEHHRHGYPVTHQDFNERVNEYFDRMY